MVIADNSIVKLNPSTHPDFIKLNDQITNLVDTVNSIEIDSQDVVDKVTLDIGLAKNLLKELDKIRVEVFLKDTRMYTSMVNNAFNKLSDPVDKLEKSVGQKITKFKQEQREAQAILDEENKRRQLDFMTKKSDAVDEDTGEITGDLPKEPDHIGNVEAKQKSSTFAGTSNTQMIPKWELDDFKLVPDEFKILDIAKIKKQVKAGVKSIPGIKIWEEEETKFRSKSVK